MVASRVSALPEIVLDGEKSSTVVETIESIKENAIGFSQGLELLNNFEDEKTKRIVFIYYREITKKK